MGLHLVMQKIVAYRIYIFIKSDKSYFFLLLLFLSNNKFIFLFFIEEKKFPHTKIEISQETQLDSNRF